MKIMGKASVENFLNMLSHILIFSSLFSLPKNVNVNNYKRIQIQLTILILHSSSVPCQKNHKMKIKLYHVKIKRIHRMRNGAICYLTNITIN